MTIVPMWIKKLLDRFISRVKSKMAILPGSDKENPFQLIYYKAGWSDAKIRKNNTKFWQWEQENR